MTDDPFCKAKILSRLVPKGCKQLVVGRGSENPNILVVGEAPGHQEDLQGKPFVGPSGEMLSGWMEYWNLGDDEYAITNIVKFHPKDENGKTRRPTEVEKDEWRPILKEEIGNLNPKLIVCLGETAKSELTDNTDEMGKCIGNTYPLRPYYGKEIPVLVIYHPSFFLHRHQSNTTSERAVRMAFQAIHEALDRPKILVLDIETDNSIDVNSAKVRAVAMYSYVYPEDRCVAFDLGSVRAAIERHTHIVGFNIKDFDVPILENNNVNCRGKVIVDLYKGLMARGRKEVMGLKATSNEDLELDDDAPDPINLPDNKLGTIVEFLKLGKKMEFDYSLLEQWPMTADVQAKIDKYAYNDIKITKALYEWWCNWAEPFKQYVSKRNQWRQTYLTCSVASYAYKAICHATGRKEEYHDESEEETKESFEGGYVSADVETAKGNIVLLDFASLYPHNFIQGNLFSPAPPGFEGPVFKANPFYPDLQGEYRADVQGDVEATLKRFYNERVKFKKAGDPRQYALKITLNSSYGAGTSPVFKSIYNPTIGPATTYIGRQNIKHMRDIVKMDGFKVLYSDTDSMIVQIPEGKTEKELMELVASGIKEIKKWLPFPADSFHMDLQEHIKYFQAFRNPKTGALLKKFYLFVNDKDEITLKGVPIVKSNSTELAKRVYARLKPQIIQNMSALFPEALVEKYIREEVAKDFSCAAKTFVVKEAGRYKVPTQLDAQIAQRYGGPARHLLIKNKLIGIGKEVRYCTVEMAKGLKFEDLDLSSTRNELSYFIKKPTLQDSESKCLL